MKTPNRRKLIEKVIKLSNLRDSNDFINIERNGERNAADNIIKELIEKYDIKDLEIILEEPLDFEKYQQYKDLYGPFCDYVFFIDYWKNIREIRPKNPYYNFFPQSNKLLDSEYLKILAKIPHIEDIEKTATFVDENLEKEIRQVIKKDKKEEIYIGDLFKINRLYVSGKDIVNLSGVDLLYNLKFLDISNNQITDLKYLENLVNLQCLNITNNPIADISYLSNLRSLISLRANKILCRDFRPLLILKNLIKLYIDKGALVDTNIRKAFKRKEVAIIEWPI